MTRRFLLISCLLLALLIPSESLPEPPPPQLIKSPLSELGARMLMNSKKLEAMSMKLLLLGRRDQPVVQAKLFDGIDRVKEIVDQVATTLRYESQLLIAIAHLQKEYRSFFSKMRIDGLDSAAETFRIFLRELKYYYEDSSYSSVLLTVGNPIRIINESLQNISNATDNLNLLVSGVNQ